jgi:hypothetical protein
MNLPSDTPKLPKWIFLAGDVTLVVAIWIVWSQSAHPVRGMPLLAIVVCAVVATVLGAFPFITDYVRWQEEALDNRQRALQALAVTVTSSAEQIAIAASGLDRLAGIAQENFNQSDKVAHQIQEKMAELLARLAEAKKDDGESAARLESVAKKIARTVTDFEAAAPKSFPQARSEAFIPPVALEVPPVLASEIVEIRPAVIPPVPPFQPAAPEAKPLPEAKPAPETNPEVEAKPEVKPEAEAKPEAAPEAAPPPAPAPAPAPEIAAPRKRAPRKPAPTAEAGQDLILESQSPSATGTAEAAAPADGGTRLVVTAYIGIGNRLCIRGEGPGLSWDKGVQMTFISIGKWRWETKAASAAVRFKLYKNDEIECTALGERTIQPGAQEMLTAAF